jgi:TRAP-type transport system periplasmic protein
MLRPLLRGLAAAAFGLAATVAAASAQTLPPGPPVNIVAITQPNPVNTQFTLVDIPFLREMPQRTGGRITVTLASHAERNLSGSEIVRLVRSGQAEIGAGTLTTLSGDVPILDGVDLAGLAPEIGKARQIAQAILPTANRDLERFGVRLVITYPFPAQVLFCRQPFRTLEDLKGRKIRTFGQSLVDLVTALGAQPVSIGFPEVYSALERGVVDCAITGTGSGASARWPEVTTHISNLPLSWAVAGYMVNLAWWNRLDPAVRSYLEANFREMEDKLWELGDVGTRDGIDCNIGDRAKCKLNQLAARPMTEVPSTPEEAQRLKQIFEAVILPGWVKRCGARCGQVYNEVIAPISGVRFGG